MPGFLILIGLVAVVSIVSTTREEREKARKRLARHNWEFALATLLLWGIVLFPW